MKVPMSIHLFLLALISVLHLYSTEQCSYGSCVIVPDDASIATLVQIKRCWVTQEDPVADGSRRPASQMGNETCQDIFTDECKVSFDLDTPVSACEEKWEANIINTSIHYANTTHYTVVLQWDPYPGASSYDVTVYDALSTFREGCTSHTNNTSVSFKLRFSPSLDKQVKITPEGTCAVASTSLNHPSNCFFLCPECSCLNSQYEYLIMPEHIETCLYSRHGDEMVLRVQWEQPHYPWSKIYNGSVHLVIMNSYHESVSEVVEVKGQTKAYLQVNGLKDTYSISVQQNLCHINSVGREIISFANCNEPLPLPSSCNPLIQPTNTTTITPPRTHRVPNNTTTRINPFPSLGSWPAGEHPTKDHLEDQMFSSVLAVTDAHLTTASNSANITHVSWIAPALIMVACAILVPFLLLTIGVMTSMKKYRFHFARRGLDKSSATEKGKWSNNKTVLVLFSQASSIKDEMRVMEHVVKAVSLYSGVHCLYFDKPSVRTSVAEWVEGAIKRSDKVLLIVNKEFVKEWDSLKAYLPHGESLVYVARQVVDSFVMRDKQQLGKFALVFLRKEDQRSLLKDSLYLQTVKSFLVLPQDEAELESLVRFILDVPTYTLSLHK